ncbi:MAG: Glycerol kinase [Parcubacteria group bacterium GW2011_GWA2_49_9]|nr:MAG: Glycerol kinase [Parcubacteria group bacterium GW2011_GWA2_49_9]
MVDIAQKLALVLDVGTTGVKAFVFDSREKVLARAAESLQKSFPQKEWVEQDPFTLLAVSKKVLQTALGESGKTAEAMSGFGIANQRETTILWDRATGEPIYPAIVWEDKRTKAACEQLVREHGKMILEKTGLQVDSYFSASKIKWILDSVSGARTRAEKGELCFGTVDTWLLWNLAGNHPHVTDVTNASRTLLFNIHTKEWDEELLSLFSIPRALLPEVRPSGLKSLSGRVFSLCR